MVHQSPAEGGLGDRLRSLGWERRLLIVSSS